MYWIWWKLKTCTYTVRYLKYTYFIHIDGRRCQYEVRYSVLADTCQICTGRPRETALPVREPGSWTLFVLEDKTRPPYLFVNLLHEFDLLLEGLTAVLGVDVVQRLVVQVLRDRGHVTSHKAERNMGEYYQLAVRVSKRQETGKWSWTEWLGKVREPNLFCFLNH